MSLPPQPKANPKRTGKRITFFNDQGVVKKESVQPTPEGPGYDLGAPVLESEHSDRAGQVSQSEGSHVYNSVIFSPEKGEQGRGHYQQTVPVKWAQQGSSRQPGWPQGVPVSSWSQNVASYLGGLKTTEAQGQSSYPKLIAEEPQRRVEEKRLRDSLSSYGDSAKTLGVEWERQSMVALQHAPAQSLQQGHMTALPSQSLAVSHAATSSVLQPFQVAFGPPKQHLPRAFYQVFQDNKMLPNLDCSGQPMSQNQFQPELQHNQQLQQQQGISHKQLEMQENQQLLDYFSGTSLANVHSNPHLQQQQPLQALGSHTQTQGPGCQPPVESLDLDAPTFSSNLRQVSEAPVPAPRRSRRLSKEGAPASVVIAGNHPAHGTQGSLNGSAEGRKDPLERQTQATTGGVIKRAHKKRRFSQEVNLETLAQKASEMECLPSRDITREQEKTGMGTQGPDRRVAEDDWANAKRPRDESLLPLVMPVSVPVQRSDQDQAKPLSGWNQHPSELRNPVQSERKPSVIVTRRRSLRGSASEISGQNREGEDGKEEDGRLAKTRRRPRPEPLFIPPPKTGAFIAPPVYSNITPYQSHLRSPVRLADHPVVLPPYTPPPILSPVREGSGLYFSTFMSSSVASAQGVGLPPPATPKSATRSLLRSSSCDITPPLLSAMNEATPVSIEPRINIGHQYQAEVPELQDRAAAQQDHHQADLVWAPLQDLGSTHQEQVDSLMLLACSSVLPGGGTNQELALHCLYECKGDILEALTLLLLQKPMFSKPHPLGGYHYSGCDSWTLAERHFFNKGIATHKKDFFMVQKIVSTKTVAQCVEFYYTYKKQVRTGRSGTLVYGDVELSEAGSTQVDTSVKSSQRFEARKEEEGKNWEESCDRKRDCGAARVSQPHQATENDGAIPVFKSQRGGTEEEQYQFRPSSPRPLPKKPTADSGKRNGPTAASKGRTEQEGEFPCKKCGRVFYKVKSRSAHMKSHAEQEKKAAALRQKEAEERAAAASRQNGTREQAGDSSTEESSVEGEDADDEDWP